MLMVKKKVEKLISFNSKKQIYIPVAIVKGYVLSVNIMGYDVGKQAITVRFNVRQHNFDTVIKCVHTRQAMHDAFPSLIYTKITDTYLSKTLEVPLRPMKAIRTQQDFLHALKNNHLVDDLYRLCLFHSSESSRPTYSKRVLGEQFHADLSIILQPHIDNLASLINQKSEKKKKGRTTNILPFVSE